MPRVPSIVIVCLSNYAEWDGKQNLSQLHSNTWLDNDPFQCPKSQKVNNSRGFLALCCKVHPFSGSACHLWHLSVWCEKCNFIACETCWILTRMCQQQKIHQFNAAGFGRIYMALGVAPMYAAYTHWQAHFYVFWCLLWSPARESRVESLTGA